MSDPFEPNRTVPAAPPDQTGPGGAAAARRTGSERLAFGPPAAAGEVGTLGPYRVVKQLGAGGMGAVYLAIDTRLERRLALKVMLPEFAADREAKERFLREAKAAAKISHDNVVTVYEADERDGVPYIAMQFLQGYPLDEYLKKRAPTSSQVLRIAREAASGLAAAHRIGLIHRDIKPANLWLESPNGRVKVLDFGLARPVDADTELTKSGAVVGTPAYMSPEQARAQKVDVRTDLFSLGVVLYRLCTGRLPFTGPNSVAVLIALGTENPPPVRELNPQVPEPLAGLIHQLLAKDPAARPPTADDVVRRIDALTDELVTSADAPSVSQPQVVYVPIQMTAVHANPFANIDATEEGSGSVETTSIPEPVPRASRPWLWALAAGAALVAAAAVFAFRNPDSSGPTGGSVAGKREEKGPGADTGGAKDQTDTGAKKDEKKKDEKKVAPDADRKAAEDVFLLGGSVRVNGEERERRKSDELPNGPFRLTGINLSSNGRIADADLAQFNDLKNLTYLDLCNTSVSSAGLAHLKGLASLTWLRLASTEITDAGLAHLTGLQALGRLDMNNSRRLTNGCLVHLKQLKSLTSLGLPGTRVNNEGMAILKECRGLTSLTLYSTDVGNAGLAHLKELTGLTYLILHSTKVNNAGMIHLKDLKELAHLDLHNTSISDVGLAHLRDLKRLVYVDVQQTGATLQGAADLNAVLGSRVVHDERNFPAKKK